MCLVDDEAVRELFTRFKDISSVFYDAWYIYLLCREYFTVVPPVFTNSLCTNLSTKAVNDSDFLLSQEF
jgi:hypothetical protein